MYAEVTEALSESGCHQAGLANLVEFEYPLWAGLRHDHWTGSLDFVGVTDQTRSLEPGGRRCAWISQQGSSYVTPDNGTVNLQSGDLALSGRGQQGLDHPPPSRGSPALRPGSGSSPVGAGR